MRKSSAREKNESGGKYSLSIFQKLINYIECSGHPPAATWKLHSHWMWVEAKLTTSNRHKCRMVTGKKKLVRFIFCITLIHLASSFIAAKTVTAEPNYPFDSTKEIRLQAIKQKRTKKIRTRTVNSGVSIFILSLNRKSPYERIRTNIYINSQSSNALVYNLITHNNIRRRWHSIDSDISICFHSCLPLERHRLQSKLAAPHSLGSRRNGMKSESENRRMYNLTEARAQGPNNNNNESIKMLMLIHQITLSIQRSVGELCNCGIYARKATVWRWRLTPMALAGLLSQWRLFSGWWQLDHNGEFRMSSRETFFSI